MVRLASLVAYGVGCLLGAYLAVVFFVANSHLSISWSVENVAGSFLPLLAALVCVFLAQKHLPRFSVAMAVGVIASAFLLFFSLVFHLFPERSIPLAVAHLVSVGVLLWLALRSYRTNNAL
jgi:hypothetical protein